MRALLVSLALLPALAAARQPIQPPAGSNWQHVQALPIGASIHLNIRTQSLNCELKSVDADSLTCTHKKDMTFHRSDIQSITIPRRGRSTAIGAAIFAGAGAAVGAGLGRTFWTTRSKGAGVGIALFTPVGALIGFGTDFAYSTVYRAP